MKGCCLGVVAGALLFAAGGMFVTHDPQLPVQAAGDVREGAAWLGAVLSNFGQTTAAPSSQPTPTPVPVTVITPGPVTTASGGTPTATPPPTAAPTPAAAVAVWSAADCSWAEDTLTHDAQLDTAAEQTVPDAATYYATWAANWTQSEQYVVQECSGIALAGNALTDPPSWFATAIQSHIADTQAHPSDQSWNDEWIAAYQRLEGLWAELPR
jgi:hypothetical protein